MNHPLPPETMDHPMAPGERLPKSERTEFSAEALAEIAAIAAKYPDKLAATLPALHIAQRDFGFVSLAAMKAVAKALSIPEGHVFGVASFYTMYQQHPVGRFHLQVCTNLPCALAGGAQLLEKVCARAGVKPGEGPSKDGMYSVEEVECLASCGSAPCLQVNADVYEEFVDEKKLDEIFDACKRGEYRAWAQ
ncbi:MAG TPA: NAD(P)H-dependent oxidoreductase subunit E [Holophagaceae bacterium]|nr:NAD(P)H-dependent oxidoreductase subunit E [Holophagaceae bacterium]